MENLDGWVEVKKLEGVMGRNGRMFVSCFVDESDKVSNFLSWFLKYFFNGFFRSLFFNNLKEVLFLIFFVIIYKMMIFI